MPTSPPDLVTAPGSPATTPARRTIWKAVLRQPAAALLSVFAVSVVTFLATNITSPRDVARGVLGRDATAGQITAFVAAHDLAAPVPVRYVRWLGDFVRGDWGTSVVTDRPIQPELVARLSRTVLLAGVSFLVVVPVSIALGGYLAARWGSRLDVAVTSGLMTLGASPEFVVGVGAILVFSVLLGVLPPESGTAIAFGTPVAIAQAYLLPALTLALVAAPFLTRRPAPAPERA
ncbi:MAG: ABC transporter permease [Pseudonocardiaceae bacterium]